MDIRPSGVEAEETAARGGEEAAVVRCPDRLLLHRAVEWTTSKDLEHLRRLVVGLDELVGFVGFGRVRRVRVTVRKGWKSWKGRRGWKG